MNVKQISVFLENKTGRINEVTRILSIGNINMSAFSIAENTDFGIMRIVVSDPQKAMDILRDNRFAVTLTDVVCINCPNTPGSLSRVLEFLAEEGVFIEYMYAFSQGETASVVIRPNDIQKCIDVLQKHKTELICSNQLYNI